MRLGGSASRKWDTNICTTGDGTSPTLLIARAGYTLPRNASSARAASSSARGTRFPGAADLFARLDGCKSSSGTATVCKLVSGVMRSSSSVSDASTSSRSSSGTSALSPMSLILFFRFARDRLSALSFAHAHSSDRFTFDFGGRPAKSMHSADGDEGGWSGEEGMSS